MPRHLSAADVLRYQQIFDLQEEGRWQEADWVISWLEDQILVGHVLFHRYMHPDYRTSYSELADWLARYGDLPGAERIHRLALRRLPKGTRPPPLPTAPDLATLSPATAALLADQVYTSARRRTAEDRRQISANQAAVLEQIRDATPVESEQTLQRLATRALLEPAEYDDLLRRIAAAYYAAGDDAKALALAAAAAKRSRSEVPLADWTAGLAAWRLGQYELARQHFEALARSERAGGWNVAAGAYWAARANLKVRRPQQVNRMLLLAAEYPRTFYGLIATRQLGRDVGFTWKLSPAQQQAMQRLDEIAGVRRAIALADIGLDDLASREIRHLYARADDHLAVLLLELASQVRSPATAMQLGQHWRLSKGWNFDAALYPVPHWQPQSGFSIDRALVYAFIRQESAFDTQAKSPAGAAGLMQLLPSTARFVAQEVSTIRGSQEELLLPEINIDLGQRYLQHLMDGELVRGNLLLLAASYNAGPGTLRRWLKEVRYDNDPLLFIESIPAAETRSFVEQVMTNLWIYRERLHQDTPSLDALAAGNWPYYVAQDDAQVWVAGYDED